MLTTAMLTKLADLRGGRRVAFFVATNRLTALDAAVLVSAAASSAVCSLSLPSTASTAGARVRRRCRRRQD